MTQLGNLPGTDDEPSGPSALRFLKWFADYRELFSMVSQGKRPQTKKDLCGEKGVAAGGVTAMWGNAK